MWSMRLMHGSRHMKRSARDFASAISVACFTRFCPTSSIADAGYLSFPRRTLLVKPIPSLPFLEDWGGIQPGLPVENSHPEERSCERVTGPRVAESQK